MVTEREMLVFERGDMPEMVVGVSGIFVRVSGILVGVAGAVSPRFATRACTHNSTQGGQT